LNLGTVRTLAANFAQDPSITRYTTARYNQAINLANQQFALDTRALWKDASSTVVSAQATYSLPTDFMWEDWISLANLPLLPISRYRTQEISKTNDWTLDTGTPTHYIIDPEEAQKKIRLYPIPQSDDAGKTLIMRYFPLPATLASDSDTPLNSSALMAQFHMGLAAFAAWTLLLSEQSTPQIVQKRNDLLHVYTDAVNKAIETFRNTVSAPLRLRPIK